MSAATRPTEASPIAASRGEPLPGDVRERFETRLGVDFSHVRVHADPAAHNFAQSVGAKAATVGSRVYFSRGRYAPGTPGGAHLLAHELAHTVQPRGPSIVHRTPEDDEAR